MTPLEIGVKILVSLLQASVKNKQSLVKELPLLKMGRDAFDQAIQQAEAQIAAAKAPKFQLKSGRVVSRAKTLKRKR